MAIKNAQFCKKRNDSDFTHWYVYHMTPYGGKDKKRP